MIFAEEQILQEFDSIACIPAQVAPASDSRLIPVHYPTIGLLHFSQIAILINCNSVMLLGWILG